ncbi:MAG: hypothetical protein JWO85_2139, partial [Candidatus Eremiobacteraeota bacterium]|nr:hypothetical protein [Candidatus Eremiobacteraeota bacterium]
MQGSVGVYYSVAGVEEGYWVSCHGSAYGSGCG